MALRLQVLSEMGYLPFDQIRSFPRWTRLFSSFQLRIPQIPSTRLGGRSAKLGPCAQFLYGMRSQSGIHHGSPPGRKGQALGARLSLDNMIRGSPV